MVYFPEGSSFQNDFNKILGNDFFWYCNAWLIREGLEFLVDTVMDGEKKEFYLLESTGMDKAFIKYKIVLKDYNNGIPSIIRKFYSDKKQREMFEYYFKDFCQFTIRSKVENLTGTMLNLFTNSDEKECLELKNSGTEFEIMFTQRRIK